MQEIIERPACRQPPVGPTLAAPAPAPAPAPVSPNLNFKQGQSQTASIGPDRRRASSRIKLNRELMLRLTMALGGGQRVPPKGNSPVVQRSEVELTRGRIVEQNVGQSSGLARHHEPDPETLKVGEKPNSDLSPRGSLLALDHQGLASRDDHQQPSVGTKLATQTTMERTKNALNTCSRPASELLHLITRSASASASASTSTSSSSASAADRSASWANKSARATRSNRTTTTTTEAARQQQQQPRSGSGAKRAQSPELRFDSECETYKDTDEGARASVAGASGKSLRSFLDLSCEHWAANGRSWHAAKAACGGGGQSRRSLPSRLPPRLRLRLPQVRPYRSRKSAAPAAARRLLPLSACLGLHWRRSSEARCNRRRRRCRCRSHKCSQSLGNTQQATTGERRAPVSPPSGSAAAVAVAGNVRRLSAAKQSDRWPLIVIGGERISGATRAESRPDFAQSRGSLRIGRDRLQREKKRESESEKEKEKERDSERHQQRLRMSSAKPSAGATRTTIATAVVNRNKQLQSCYGRPFRPLERKQKRHEHECDKSTQFALESEASNDFAPVTPFQVPQKRLQARTSESVAANCGLRVRARVRRFRRRLNCDRKRLIVGAKALNERQRERRQLGPSRVYYEANENEKGANSNSSSSSNKHHTIGQWQQQQQQREQQQHHQQQSELPEQIVLRDQSSILAEWEQFACNSGQASVVSTEIGRSEAQEASITTASIWGLEVGRNSDEKAKQTVIKNWSSSRSSIEWEHLKPDCFCWPEEEEKERRVVKKGRCRRRRTRGGNASSEPAKCDSIRESPARLDRRHSHSHSPSHSHPYPHFIAGHLQATAVSSRRRFGSARIQLWAILTLLAVSCASRLGPRSVGPLSGLATSANALQVDESDELSRAVLATMSTQAPGLTNGNGNANNNNNKASNNNNNASFSTESFGMTDPDGLFSAANERHLELANGTSSSSSSAAAAATSSGNFGLQSHANNPTLGQSDAPQMQTQTQTSIWDKLLDFGRIFIICAIIVGDICGNSLVILSVCRHSKLRVTTNWFVVSLACADILVALFAMTFNASYIISGRWLFKPWVCDFWNSCDVLASTASILHLCCISIDRYIAIMRPLDYPMKITTRRVVYALCAVWISSALLSYIPIFTGIYTTSEHIQWLQDNPDQCEFVVNRVYAIVSSSISFWIPCCIMVFTYYRIYREATRQEKFIYKAQSMMPAPMVNHHHHGTNHTSASSSSGNSKFKQRRSKSVAVAGSSSGNKGALKLQQDRNRQLLQPIATTTLNSSPKVKAAQNMPTVAIGAQAQASDNEANLNGSSELNASNERASSLLQLDQTEQALAESQPLAAGTEQTISNVAAANTLERAQVKPASANQLCVRQTQQPPVVGNVADADEQDDDLDSNSGQSTPTKRSISKMKREHKAAKTLGIIMGVFILCWLPFFSWYTPQHICGHACDGIVPKSAVTLLFWIGYFNSTLNPIIYAYFNHEFRDAFKKTLQWIFCCCNDLKCLRVNRPNDNQHYNCTYRSTQEIGLVSNG